jgi:hypothetical protein
MMTRKLGVQGTSPRAEDWLIYDVETNEALATESVSIEVEAGCIARVTATFFVDEVDVHISQSVTE